MSSLELKIPPPIVALVAALLMWLAPALDGRIFVPYRPAVAIALACFGLSIAISGVVAFRQAKTTVNPIKASRASSLVIVGIYQHTRNPMYLGLVFALLAWSVFLANPLALLFLPVFVVYINRFQIAPEERILTGLFGNEFSTYKQRVRRWL